MLHVLLMAFALWILAAFAATFRMAPVSFSRLFNPFVLEVSYVIALVLLRLGNFRRASLAYLTGVWIWGTLICFFAGGIRSPGALLYVSLPASAAWLLGYTASIWTAGGCLLGALVFTVLEMVHVRLPLQIKATPLGIWAVIVQAVMVNAIPLGQIIGRPQEALDNCSGTSSTLSRLWISARTNSAGADQAESANRAKSDFLANMSHELRTPLSVILAYSELLIDSNPTPDQREDIVAISRSGEHLRGLIADVLDVAVIEAGKEELAIEASDLFSTVRTVVAMMRGRAEEKHLVLRYDQAPKVPRYVRVDSSKLRQILINLLGNAIKFTREGTVRLRLSALPVDEPGRARICFEVEDSGAIRN